MNVDRVDKTLQYALLVAGEEDEFFDRQLGPIHLIKYVYLADLAYAENNNGETFTGVNWQFHKFGPWTQEVNERIEPALLYINADKQTFPSDYGDKGEWVRWTATDDTAIQVLERNLPFIVTSTISRNVHKFGKATPELLAYVYSTEPMLAAAPKEFLNFTNLRAISKNETQSQDCQEPLSKKKKKIFEEKIRNLKALSSKKFTDKKKKCLVKPPLTPIYDDVYFEGIEWLDSLAGTKLEVGEKEAIFSDSMWKSPARRGDSVSD